MGIILVIITFFLTKLIMTPLKVLLISSGAVRKNYQGKDIPIGLGLVLLFGIIPSFFIYGIIRKDENTFLIMLVLTLTLLVGLIDDLLGNHSVKGLKGHLLKLFIKKELTSGSLKAIFISVISLLVALYYWENTILFVLNFVILILTTNSFNLFDVRPGRAIKVYFLAYGLISIFSPQNTFYLGLIFTGLIAYAPLDFRGKGMLGDTGSNFLGMAVGLALIFNLAFISKVVAAILLIVLHFYTEKKSLTELIEKIFILRLIDNLGR